MGMKHNAMHTAPAGAEQLQAFSDPIAAQIRIAVSPGRIRGTKPVPDVRFGPYDAHGWNGTFSFHLVVHDRQAAPVAGVIKD